MSRENLLNSVVSEAAEGKPRECSRCKTLAALAERTSRGLRDIEEAVSRAVERSKAGSPALPAPLSEEITRLLLAILVIVQSKRGAATIEESLIVPECPGCHARDSLMVCCWRCASEGSPEQFNARIVPAPPPAEPR